MLVQSKGMKKLEKSVKPGNYNNLWCAGQSVQLISDVKSIDNIVQTIMKEHSEAKKNLMEI
jgi:nitronate monooxygenase